MTPAATLLLIIAGTTLVRIAALIGGWLDLQPDEAQYWWWAQTPAWGYVSKPPLIAWLIAATTGVCGDGAACVRLSSPILHGAVTGLVYRLAADLGDRRTALAAAAGYATLPGVTLSGMLISTDAPLLFAWSLGLLALLRSGRGTGLGWPLLLGLALAIGLLAKQAMLYFLPCAALAALWDERVRAFLLSRRVLLSLLPAALAVAPVLAWNAHHGWATVAHTADNAAWSHASFRWEGGAAFLADQLAVMGPLAFPVFAFLAARRLVRRDANDAAGALLLAFSLPVIMVLLVQGVIVRANANWAAVAYVAAIVFLVRAAPGWARGRPVAGAILVNAAAALALHAALIILPLLPSVTTLPHLERFTGWRPVGRELAARMTAEKIDTIVFDDRKIMAEMLYYLEPRARAARIVDADGRAGNEFERTLAYRSDEADRIMVATRDDAPLYLEDGRRRLRPLPPILLPSSRQRPILLHLFVLAAP